MQKIYCCNVKNKARRGKNSVYKHEFSCEIEVLHNIASSKKGCFQQSLVAIIGESIFQGQSCHSKKDLRPTITTLNRKDLTVTASVHAKGAFNKSFSSLHKTASIKSNAPLMRIIIEK